jgi:hypothetical protein
MGLTRSQKTIICLVKKLGNMVGGRKKLMKLMFLVEHYDLDKGKLTKSSFLGNNFIIFHYGVFSFNVMNDYMLLNNEGMITECPIKTESDIIDIDDELKSKIDGIVSEFGSEHGYKLEENTLEMLGISKETKNDFFGKDVKELIKE